MACTHGGFVEDSAMISLATSWNRARSFLIHSRRLLSGEVFSFKVVITASEERLWCEFWTFSRISLGTYSLSASIGARQMNFGGDLRDPIYQDDYQIDRLHYADLA